MNKLLATLGLFLFLTSPAAASHIMLIEPAVTCVILSDATGYIHVIKSESESPAVGELTKENMEIAAQNNNCEFRPAFTVYAEYDEYVCEFTLVGENFTLLDNKTTWSNRFIIVKGTIFRTADKRTLQCIQERQPN